MTDENPTERFFSRFLKDWAEGEVRPVESYLDEFPSEKETVIRAAFNDRTRIVSGSREGHLLIRESRLEDALPIWRVADRRRRAAEKKK